MKVSVIMPIYNESKYIREALYSYASQCLEDKELICVDDGSTDDSLKIVEEFRRTHNNIRILSQNRQGAGAARNLGLSVAKGKYVCFLDADDVYVDNNALLRLYEEAERDNIKVCAGLLQVYQEGQVIYNNILRDLLRGEETRIVEYMDFQYDYQYQCYIFEASFLRETNIIFPLYKRFQDPPFLVQALFRAKKFKIINVEFYGYTLGEKKIEYTKEKTNDLFRGLLFNLKFAWKNNLDILLNLTIKRINGEYFDILYNGIKITNIELLSLLIEADSIAKDCGKVIRPLEELLILKERSGFQESKERCFLKEIKSRFPNANRVVLYGAGNIGTRCQVYIEKDNYFQQYIWVDKYKYGKIVNGKMIEKVEEILRFEYDYIILSILNEKVKEEVRLDLKRMGIKEERLIIWQL